MCRTHVVILFLVAFLVSAILVGCGPTKGTAEWHSDQGHRLIQQGSYDEAIEECSKAIELNPGYADAYYNRAVACEHLGQFQRAIEDYDEAIRLNPEDADSYYNRGVAYSELGKKADAVAEFENVITLTDNPQLIQMAKQQIEELSR